MDFPASVYGKPTTPSAVRAAGIRLSEEPGAHATLRVVCILVPQDVGDEEVVHVGYAVQSQRANKAWVDIMADLPEGEADANVDRTEALFGPTPDEQREAAAMFAKR